ncbi:hypothetical protein ACQEU8_17385 [Streptomyces sp. CA-250714]|uniref:hypothetical protein n=1 Tax=Streptomyces sp. CA-250714 TaxID=3240060 RepID=UPI003D8F779D
MSSGAPGARYYRVDCENGITVDDPSEDSLHMLIGDLDGDDNTFLVLQPDAGSGSWFATVAVLEDGGFDVVRRDPERHEHEVTTETSVARIAHELTVWAARRVRPSARV